MGRIYLMNYKSSKHEYELIDESVDYIGAYHNGVPSIMGAEVLYAADSFPDLLHQIKNSNDQKYYVVLDHIDSNRSTRTEKYPHYQSISPLSGYISSVCDYRIDRKCYTSDWQVDFVGDLWVKDNDDVIVRVKGFQKRAYDEVYKFIEIIRLKYTEAGTKEEMQG